MHLNLVAVFATAFAVTVTAIPLQQKYAVKDSHPVPARWHKVAPAPADETLNLRIGLKHERFADLERHLYEGTEALAPWSKGLVALAMRYASTRHRGFGAFWSRYGQHLLAEEVNNIIAPSETASRLVHEWLADHGISKSQLSYSPAKDWIKVKLSISDIEELLQTEYSTFEDKDGHVISRAPEWSLPLHLHEHIATIQPTNSFMRPKKETSGVKYLGEVIDSIPAPASSATLGQLYNASAVTPTFLRTLYGTINYTVQAADKNKMSLTNYLGEINNRSDAELYLKRFRPEAAAAAYQFQQISIDGGTVQQTPLNATQLAERTGIEGALDTQTMLGVAWPTPLDTYSTGGLNPVFIPDLFTTDNSDEPYIVWLEYVLGLPDAELPKVVSTSYGDDEQTIPYSYAAQACNMMAQLGARGVSLLFSSGDQGVGADGYCYTNDGRNASTFLPSFPASCPYVTAVGGTMRFSPEVAVFDGRFATPYTSGGGFSNYFPSPGYQSGSVSNYLTKYIGPQYAGLYNPSGRGYPDISASSSNFSIYWNGTIRPVSGTSASSPLMGSIIALVNDALLAAGKPVLGFLNPWIYSGGYKAFTDIVGGSSQGCDTGGFPAQPGWDAVTGFGTPYFPAILENLGI